MQKKKTLLWTLGTLLLLAVLLIGVFQTVPEKNYECAEVADWKTIFWFQNKIQDDRGVHVNVIIAGECAETSVLMPWYGNILNLF